MEKKTIFTEPEYRELRRRIESLRPDAAPIWGKMNVAQMLAHCCAPLESGLGKLDLAPEGNFIFRWLLKKWVLSKTIYDRNLPTAKQFLVRDERDFAAEKARLLADLDEAYALGPGGNWAKHPSFGDIGGARYGELTHVHLSHHLAQFGA